MTSRSTTLIFTALLLLASLAGAAAPAPNGAPATAALMTPAAPTQASPSCDPLLAKLGLSPFDSAKNASTYPACGGCSDLACRGLAIYDFCGGTIRQPKRCKASGYMCSVEDNTVKPKCLCVDAILP